LIAELARVDDGLNKANQLQWGRDQLIAELTWEGILVLPEVLLQWGRDQLIAEFTTATALFAAGHRLQWGRDQLIAEFTSPPDRWSTCAGFNGAAIN